MVFTADEGNRHMNESDTEAKLSETRAACVVTADVRSHVPVKIPRIREPRSQDASCQHVLEAAELDVSRVSQSCEFSLGHACVVKVSLPLSFNDFVEEQFADFPAAIERIAPG